MQYILPIFNDSQTLLKSKLSKLRHLESLFFFLLIVALLFLQMFQNHNLREQLLRHKTDYMVQQLLQQRMPHIQKQIEEMRNYFHQENIKLHQKMDQNKKLILSLSKELGLPIQETEEQHLRNIAKEAIVRDVKTTSNLEVIQILPERDDALENDEEADQNGQQDQYWENIPQEQIILQQRQIYSPQNEKQETEQRNNHNFLDTQKPQVQINISNYAKIICFGQQNIDQIHKWLVYIGKIILVLILMAVLFVIVFYKKSKGRQDKPSIRNLWKKIYPQGKKRQVMKGQKQTLL